MTGGGRMRTVWRAVGHYVTFFILVAFVITCCMTLFLQILSDSLDITFTSENIALAAKVTFWNVILISLIFTVLDTLRRRLTVDLPVKRISEAAERMKAGDFEVRIERISDLIADGKFNEIIDCINHMAEELSGVETLRADFIANVSHEMKTPLAVMQNYGRLLKSDDLSEEKRMEYAEVIVESAQRLADMMTNILKLNRLENQQIYPVVQTFDLGEALCEALLQFENIWERRGIEIETDIADGVFVSADRELLSLVWNNLLSNAFKFTDDGGRVALKLAADEQFATVRVEDTGCGISAEIGAHIFEKFYQGDTSHATQGNGLGLALVKRVIDIVEGEISVDSTVGVGTAFSVKIRRARGGL